MSRRLPLPSQAALLAMLHYEPATGLLLWRRRPERAPRWNSRHAGKVAGCEMPRGNVTVRINGKAFQAHRIIWKMLHDAEPDEIDHEDGDPGNNREKNLRPCTHAENLRNQARQYGKKYAKGVDLFRGLYRSRIRINGKTIVLGNFSTESEAIAAYGKAAKLHFGSFARID